MTVFRLFSDHTFIHYLHSTSFPLWFVISWCPFIEWDFEDIGDPFFHCSALCQVKWNDHKAHRSPGQFGQSQFPTYSTVPRKTPMEQTTLGHTSTWNSLELGQILTFGNVPLHAQVFLCSSKGKEQIFDFTELNSWHILRMMMECLIFQWQSSQSLKQQLQHEKVVVLKKRSFKEKGFKVSDVNNLHKF